MKDPATNEHIAYQSKITSLVSLIDGCICITTPEGRIVEFFLHEGCRLSFLYKASESQMLSDLIPGITPEIIGQWMHESLTAVSPEEHSLVVNSMNLRIKVSAFREQNRLLLLWCFESKPEVWYHEEAELLGKKIFPSIIEEPQNADYLNKETKAILDTLIEIVFQLDSNLNILWANQAACDTLKMTREQILKKKCHAVCTSQNTICPGCPVNKAIHTNCPHEGEYISSDGKSWYIRGYPTRDSIGNVTGAVKVMLETTTRTIAEKALTESEERFKVLAHAALEGVAIVDKEGKVLEVNNPFAKMFGYTMGELPGKDVSMVIAPEHLGEALEHIKESHKGTLRHKAIRKDGYIFSVETNARFIPLGKETFIVVTMRDISKQVLAEKIRTQDMERIEALLALSRIDYSDAHEICDYVLEKAIALTESQIGYIAFTNDDESEITMYAWSGQTNNRCGIREEVPSVFNVHKPGFLGKAVKEKKPIIINDYTVPHPFKRGIPEGHFPINRYMSIPVFDNEKIVMEAAVANKDDRYEERDIRQLTLLMNGAWRQIQRQQAEEDLRRFFNVVLDLFCVSDMHGHALRLSPSWTKSLGWTEEELKSKNFIEFVHPDDRPSAIATIKNLTRRKTVLGFDHRCLSKDGSYRWISWNAIADTKQHLIYAAARDITERKIGEVNLRESEERFRNVVESSPMGMYLISIFDHDKLIVNNANAAADKILGIDHNRYIGKDIRILLPAISDEVITEFKKTCIVGIPLHLEQVKYDDEKIHGAFELYSFQVSPGSIAIMFNEVTERIKAREDLILAKEKAEESDRLKSSFLANMSHEIRTPMNSILGFSYLLTNENLQPEKRKTYAEIIRDSTQQLLTIINDIIDLSKIEAHQIKLRYEPCHLNSLFSQLEEQFEQEKLRRGKSNVSIFTSLIFDDQHDQITTDPVRLRQILFNLLSNALKFTQKGSIRFGYEKISDNELLFFVKDTGKGIAPDRLTLIFERFRQEDEAISLQFGGSGLGLSISKGLVELFGGKIWVESELEKGSIFLFTLPISSEKQGVKTTGVPYMVSEQIDLSRKKLLVIEDTLSNMLLIEEYLSSTGAILIKAINGKQAIDILENTPDIDLILADIRLPDINGYELIRKIRLHDVHVPIIAQTAYANSEDKQKCMEAGANNYIVKPFQKKAFLKMISAQLHWHR